MMSVAYLLNMLLYVIWPLLYVKVLLEPTG